eukprot:1209251-Pyramimonas_sp.AAC.1
MSATEAVVAETATKAVVAETATKAVTPSATEAVAETAGTAGIPSPTPSDEGAKEPSADITSRPPKSAALDTATPEAEFIDAYTEASR